MMNLFLSDINLGNILSLIKENSDSNSAMARNRISVMELDFYKEDYPPELLTTIENTDLIIAADGGSRIPICR